MSHYDGPDDFFVKTVIAVYDKVSRIDNLSCRAYIYLRIDFKDPVHRFSDYTYVSFDESELYSVSI